MTDKKIKIGAVVGCTASGKTALAIELAKRLDGEIICCDSMQIYKEMDIGTAKPTAEEKREVVHHLTDFLPPDTLYSCADYVNDAEKVVLDISSRGKLPLFCGGTGLYLDRFLRGGTEDSAASLPDYREELYRYSQIHGVNALYSILEQKDMDCAARIHPNNVKRVIRALEIIKATGQKKSDIDKINSCISDKYESVIIFPWFNDRNLLYSRIDRRVDKMISDGLVGETERLYRKGIFKSSSTASQAIGYKELMPYVLGDDTLENCVEKLKVATRRYAKRQITWFSSKEYVHKIEMDDLSGEKKFEDIVNISEKLFHC